jgi:hypothetical protein
VLWPAIAALLALHADPRALDAARALEKEHVEFGWLPIAIARRAPAVTTGGATRRARAAPAGTPRTVAEWERWVLEEPGDDARRDVFRDWLLDRGDPRGLEKPAKKHAAAWLAPLGRFVLPRRPLRFARGFPVELTVRATRAVELPDPEHHLWKGVESLIFEQWDAPATVNALDAFLHAPNLAGLRALRGLPATLFQRVVERPLPALEILGGELPWRADESAAALAALGRADLSRIEELELASGRPDCSLTLMRDGARWAALARGTDAAFLDAALSALGPGRISSISYSSASAAGSGARRPRRPGSR